MKEVGTLKELSVKPGDVVECVSHTKYAGLLWTCYERHPDGYYDKPCIVYKTHWQEGYLKADGTGDHWKFRIISRASDTPKTWGADEGWSEWTSASEWNVSDHDVQMECVDGIHRVRTRPRVRPEPKRETVTLHGRKYISKTHPEARRNDARRSAPHGERKEVPMTDHTEKPKRCSICHGRGYIRCDCWPFDCICGWDDEPCEYCCETGVEGGCEDDYEVPT